MIEQVKGMEFCDWMAKADGDRDVASIEYLRRNHPDIACYHVQQAMEKYLKAQLVSLDVAPRQSHNISALLDDLSTASGVQLDPSLRAAARQLTFYEAASGYPGPEFSSEDYGKAVSAYDRVSASLRQAGFEVPRWHDPIRYSEMDRDDRER